MYAIHRSVDRHRSCLLLLAVLLCNTPVLAQGGGTTGARLGMQSMGIGSRAIGTTMSNQATTLNRAGAANERWLTSRTRASAAIQRDAFGRSSAVQRDRFGRNVHANAVARGGVGRADRDEPSNIMTGTNQRIDILTGRPID